MVKKPHYGPDLGLLGPNSSRQLFVIKLVVRHCSKLSSYAMNLQENYRTKLDEKTNSGPDFGSQIFFEGFTSTRC